MTSLYIKIKPLLKIIKSIPLMFFLFIMTLIALISEFFEKKAVRSREEVEHYLLLMLANEGYDELWDEFINSPIKNKNFNNIRQQIEILWEYADFHEENSNGDFILNNKGLSELREIIDKLNALN